MRHLLATGPQLIGVQPNQGELLQPGDVRNVAPQELTFNFSYGQEIDAGTLGAIYITRSGGDFQFATAAVRTDFNTKGSVVVEFRSKSPGPTGEEISLWFSKRNMGGSAPPKITVEGKTIFVELNSTPGKLTTVSALISAINKDAKAKELVVAELKSGLVTTEIASREITYSPLNLHGANQASVMWPLNTPQNTTGTLGVAFTAVERGPSGNGIRISVSQSNRGGFGDPSVTVDQKTRIVNIVLNSTPGYETTAAQLAGAVNANPQARALLVASAPVGDPNAKVSVPAANPLLLTGANDVQITPGYVGLGETARQVVFRFAEPLPDDLYRVDIEASGSGALRNTLGLALGDLLDDGKDLGVDYSLQFELDLAPQVLAVVPQPLTRSTTDLNPNTPAFEDLVQHTTLIQVYFNDDDIAQATAQNKYFYQLTFTDDQGVTGDPFYPVQVQYDAKSDRANLWFGSGQLNPGTGTIRLRIGTDEPVPLSAAAVTVVEDPGTTFATAKDLSANFQDGTAIEVVHAGGPGLDGQTFTVLDAFGNPQTFEFNDPSIGGAGVSVPHHRAVIYEAGDNAAPSTKAQLAAAIEKAIQEAVAANLLSVSASLNETLARVYLSGETAVTLGAGLSAVRLGKESLVVSSAIEPQLYELISPGANDEPGHRAIPEAIQSHLLQAADSVSGITTLFYNFRADYGRDPNGTVLANLISADQRQRAQEVFEVYGQLLGVQFIESATQGITVATGDLRALDATAATGRGGITRLSGVSPYTRQPTVIMDGAENWYDLFGRSDDPLRPDSWFEAALVEVGRVLGLGDTYELPPGTMMGSEPTLAFGKMAEAIYPGSQDVVHGQHLYRPDGKDVDLYRIQVTRSGVLTAETIAERQADSSLLDSVISLYRERDGQRELIARNDDYFGEDSYLRLAVEPGVYYVGVSASGNTAYNPEAEDTGFGGVTEGEYDLRLSFQADAEPLHIILDADNSSNPAAGTASQATPLDGDGDGVPGGNYNFWFRVGPRTLFVDTYLRPGENEGTVCPGTGSLASPFCTIPDALAKAQAGDIIRIVGNGGADGDLGTPEDNQPYLIGFDMLGRPLADGTRLEVPKGVTFMVDSGAVFKLRRGYIEAGSHRPTENRSGGVFQVLGTPALLNDGGIVRRDAVGNPLSGEVHFTSLLDDSLGGDSVPGIVTQPAPGEWGGILYRSDLDRAARRAGDANRLDWEDFGLFANGISHASIRYGGGTVLIDGIPQVVAPVQIFDSRPTLTFNTIRYSAQSAISANPDSFRETDFLSPTAVSQNNGDRLRKAPLDYVRVGPEIHGNRLTDNSINGLFIRVRTPAGSNQEQMTVTGRWDDTDVVHVVTENLRIAGSPGGPIQNPQELAAPNVELVAVQAQGTGNVPAGMVDYRLTFVDAQGREGPASNPTASVLVSVVDPDMGTTQSVSLANLPVAPDAVKGQRKLYRATKSGTEYVLVKVLDATSPVYVDDGTTQGGLLEPSLLNLKARTHGQLKIDPGTVVKLSGAGIETKFGSQLLAEGLEGREIVFTSLQDGRYGAGGTFATNTAGGLAAGNWTGLYLGPMSGSSLDHAVLAYGGGVAEVPGTIAGFNVVEIQQADVRIANSVFEFNADGRGGQAGSSRVGRGSNGAAAVFVRGAQPVIAENVLRSNAGPAISIDVNSLNYVTVADGGRSTGELGLTSDLVYNQGPLIRGNRLGDNDLNGLQVRGGTLTTQGVWDDTDIVHLLLDETVYVPDFHTFGGLRLQSSADSSLVVKLFGYNAGITATGRTLDINDRVGGMLHVLGQPNFPVVMTSLYDDSVGAGFDPAGKPQTVTSKNPALTRRLAVIEEQSGAGYTFVGPGAGVSTDGLGTADTGTLQAEIPANATIERAYLHVAVTSLQTAPPLVLPAFIAFQNQLVALTWLPNVMDTELFNFETGRADVTDIVRAGVGAGGGIFNFVVDETATGIAGNIEGSSLSVVFSDPLVTDVRTVILLDGGISGARPQAGTVKFAAPIDLGSNPYFVAQLALGIQNSDNTRGTQFTYVEVDRQPLTGSAGNADDGDVVPGEAITVGGVGDSPANPANPMDPRHVDPDDELYTLDSSLSPLSQSFDLQVGNPSGGDSVFLIALNVSGTAQYLPYSVGFPADWNSLRLEQWSHDRNVEVAVESETARASISGVNDTPGTAQHLGQLAPYEYGGDDIRRLGFEVHGTLNRADDWDVYSFDADVGTEVWLDIDRTSHSLDSVLELIDSTGYVIARSDDSGAELVAGAPAYSILPSAEVGPLAGSPQGQTDLWTVNPKDAGMRLVLPGPQGTTNTYYVRVSGGANTEPGGYQLQVRLSETDELPGSTVQGADIRFATNGIEVLGLPVHSPLSGESAEAVDRYGNDNNNALATADALGNLLSTDRGTLSVAGAVVAQEVQQIAFPAPPERGNFVLNFRGLTTRNLAFNAPATEVQYALEALATVGPGNVAVTGSVVDGFTVTFQGNLANQDVPQMVALPGTLPIFPATARPVVSTLVEGRSWDVDWYQFEVRYDSVPTEKPGETRYVSTVFDLDYADGLARANTNLWVFNQQGRLILGGRDSDVPEDRPLGAEPQLDDLSRGSVGTLDPFIGPSALLAPGTYYVAVSSNAVIPAALQQFLQPATTDPALPLDPLVRLEPATSVNRIAEDHLEGSGIYATATAPQVPELFGTSGQVTLFPPLASVIADGETFALTNAVGNTVVYEFDLDGTYTGWHVPIQLDWRASALDVGVAIAAAIEASPPLSAVLPLPNEPDQPVPTASRPLIFSTLDVEVGDQGEVRLQEHVVRRTLLTAVTTRQTDPNNPNQKMNVTTPVTRDTQYDVALQVAQQAASGKVDFTLFVSRPAVVPFRLGDVTLFVAEPGAQDSLTAEPLMDNRTDLVTVDPFTGQLETRVGAFGYNVGDLAMYPRGYFPDPDDDDEPRGGLFAYSIREPSWNAAGRWLTTDANTGDYVKIDPSATTAFNLASSPGDDEVETSNRVGANFNAANVGILYNALTFTNTEASGNRIRGFAAGDRGDAADQFDQSSGVPKRQNLLYEFEPDTGTVMRGGLTNPQPGSGVDAVDLGDLYSDLDTFPANGIVPKIIGVEATIDSAGQTLAKISDGDFFGVYPADGNPTIQYEFDSGHEFRVNVDVANPNPTNPQHIRDGDSFRVNGRDYEFDTGSVLVINAIQGSQLLDTRFRATNTYTFTISVPSLSGATLQYKFEFLSRGYAPHPDHIPIYINDRDTRADIVRAIENTINDPAYLIVTSDTLVADELDGTGRITLRWLNGSTMPIDVVKGRVNNPIWPTTAYEIEGASGVAAGAAAIPIEETSTGAEIAKAAADVVNWVASTEVPPKPLDQRLQAGAAGNRLNFQNFDGNGVTFSYVNPPRAIFSRAGDPGVSPGRTQVKFLVSDNGVDIAKRIEPALGLTGVLFERTGSVIELTVQSATFECDPNPDPLTGNSCPLISGATAPGGSITGLAFVGPQLYAVTDSGGLFRIADKFDGVDFNPDFPAGALPPNVLDYADASRELLMEANPLSEPPAYAAPKATFDANSNTITITEPANTLSPFAAQGFVVGGRLEISGTAKNNGTFTIERILDLPPVLLPTGEEVTQIVLTLASEVALAGESDVTTAVLKQTYEPFRFAGLVAGPQNAEDGRYANLLFAISDTGRIVAMDTHGNPQPVFANSTYFADTGIDNPRGLAFSNLDDNLWHTTTNRGTAADLGHGTTIPPAADNTSLYFGYENAQVQPQLGTGPYVPATQQRTYDFPGGAQGSLVSNPFSLAGYSSADKPTLYFNYFLETENANAVLGGSDPMRDAVRVYGAGADGRWILLGTNNSATGATNSDDEFDRFPMKDPVTGEMRAEQPIDRAQMFDNTNAWRQARVDLSPLAGQAQIRLRFDFSTAGGMSSGGLDLNLDLNTAGNELRAVPGAELRDGQTFTLGLLDPAAATPVYQETVTFEFEMGFTIVAPTGAAVRDGDTFEVDGRRFEFDLDGNVGFTQVGQVFVANVAVPFTGRETAGELAAAIEQAVVSENPSPPQALPELVLSDSRGQQNDVLDQAMWSGLAGAQQLLTGSGAIGDNPTLGVRSDDPKRFLDVDLVALRLDAGDRLVVEAAPPTASELRRPYVRLFDYLGAELAVGVDAGAAGATGTIPNVLDFTAPYGGTFYVGISGDFNPAYDPFISGSGTLPTFKRDTEIPYVYSMTVVDPLVPRVGNRVNLPQAKAVVVPATSGLPRSFVEDNVSDPQAGRPLVRVHAGMSDREVADAIRSSLAEYFGGGDLEAVKSRGEFVQVVRYAVLDAGPLGLSGPSDPATALAGSGLFGDRFGAFGASAGVNGQITAATPGALRMRDNIHEGVYIDDIVIGFASRGEVIAGESQPVPGGGPAFVPNTSRPANEIEQGVYQLEIRQATQYAAPVVDAETGVASLVEYRTFDVNERLSDGVTLVVQDGSSYTDGWTFSVSDGSVQSVFELRDVSVAGGVAASAPGRVAVPFDPGDSDVVLARRLRDAVNSAAAQEGLQVRATSPDGVYSGPSSTSNRVELWGKVTVSVGAHGGAASGLDRGVESNDVLGSAVATGIGQAPQPEPVIRAIDATLVVGGRTEALIRDGDVIVVDPKDGSDPLQFVFDTGFEFTLDVNADDLSDPQVVRDGERFVVDGQTYEFDTGAVLVIKAASGSQLLAPGGGTTTAYAFVLRITTPAGGIVSYPFAFWPRSATTLPTGYFPVYLAPGDDRAAIVKAVETAIGTPQIVAGGDTLVADELDGTGRITLRWAQGATHPIDAVPDTVGTLPPTTAYAVEGVSGVVVPNAVPVFVEETATAVELGQVVVAAVAAWDNVDAGSQGNRMNLLGVSTADFSGVGRPIFVPVGVPETPGQPAVPFLAGDDGEAIALRLQVTFAKHVLESTVRGPVVTLTDPGYVFVCNPGTAGSAAHCPLLTTDTSGNNVYYRAAGVIGDNARVTPFSADVDLYRVALTRGQTITVDIDTDGLDSPLDSVLRVFYATGTPVQVTDAWGRVSEVRSDDDAAPDEEAGQVPGQAPTRDSFLVFTAPSDGVYYVGVSGFGNEAYDATVEGSGRASSTSGRYEIVIQNVGAANQLGVIERSGYGLENLFRDQGQLVLRGNVIQEAWEYGIQIAGAERESTDATHPGPVRNLSHVNTSRLVPGITVTNNVLAFNRSGGIRFAGDPGSTAGAYQQPAAVPFGRIVNNTIYGGTAYKSRSSQVDVVFLIDTSGSMQEDIDEIRQRLGTFQTEMDKARIDAYYGLVTFPGTNPNEDPKLLQDIVDFTTFINGPFSTFALTGGTEKGSRAVREGLNDFDDTTTFNFRPGSTIVPVLITDEGDDAPEDLDPAIRIATFMEAVVFGITLDPSLPFDFDGDPNHYDQIAAATGGRTFDIGAFRLDPSGFFEAFTVAVTGGVVRPASVGIVVENDASPTILNNVVASKNIGIQVAADSSSTVLAGNVYQDNGTTAIGVGGEDFAIYLDRAERVFQKPSGGDFYPVAGSRLIDSSVESFEDRFALVQVKQQLGISTSPILVRDEDLLGQLRVDDPSVAPPTGIGANVFKDRGAVERADFQGPAVSLLYPLDNNREDLDRRLNAVNVLTSLDRILIQVTDRTDGVMGTGVSDESVTLYAVKVFDGGRLLTEGVDYAFEYHAADNTISLTPLAGVWERGRNYVIQLANVSRITISGKSGAELQDGDVFHLRDQLGSRATFEFDSGYVIEVPQTLAVQVPPQGGGPGGVADGDLITVSDGTHSVTLELDSNGVFDPANERVQFKATSSQGEIADALVTALKRLPDIILYPANAGSGLVHLGVDGTQTLTVVSNALTPLGVPQGVAAYDEFVTDDFSKHLTFFFAPGTPTGSLNQVKIPFEYSQTNKQVAASIANSINLAGLGLFAVDLGDGRVHVGGGLNHYIETPDDSPLILTGEPGVQLPFGIRIPTEAGKFFNLIADGDYFTITDLAGVAATFEFDSNNFATPGTVPIPFKSSDSTSQLANTLAATVRNAGLGLYPYNAGYGIVVFGGIGHLLDLSHCTLMQVGVSGVPGAVAVPFRPNDTAADVSQTVAQVVNDQRMPGVTAVAEGDEVVILGASDVAGQVASLFAPIRDVAGNPLRVNQTGGTTTLTVSLAPAMDYGDAPSPYPTFHEHDGARHLIVPGFSLGASLDADADGRPSDAADGDDRDGVDDEDGIVFDPNTPLVPGRSFNIMVSTSGIIEGVAPRGVLNVWIDYNGKEGWENNERVLSNFILDASTLDANGMLRTPIQLTVPSSAVPGETFARFRLSDESLTSPTGEAGAGEVEDYRVFLTANPWQNSSKHHDVNGDGHTSPVDALLVINYLNNFPTNPLPLPRSASPPFYDVNGDGNATAADVLPVINEINRLNQTSGGEGEADSQPRLASTAGSNHLEDVLRGGEDWLDIVADVDRSLGSSSAIDAVFADFGA